MKHHYDGATKDGEDAGNKADEDAEEFKIKSRIPGIRKRSCKEELKKQWFPGFSIPVGFISSESEEREEDFVEEREEDFEEEREEDFEEDFGNFTASQYEAGK